jgi:hypothetical protein
MARALVDAWVRKPGHDEKTPCGAAWCNRCVPEPLGHGSRRTAARGLSLGLAFFSANRRIRDRAHRLIARCEIRAVPALPTS